MSWEFAFAAVGIMWAGCWAMVQFAKIMVEAENTEIPKQDKKKDDA